MATGTIVPLPTSTNGETAGISCSSDQLQQGLCTMSPNGVLGINKNDPAPDVLTYVQDITLSATFIIGTVVTIALLYSGWIYVTAKDDSQATKAKNGIKWSFIGLLLVISAYTIIRLVQYVAKG